MVNYRKFEISDEIFSGFTVKIDLDMVESLEYIVEYMINGVLKSEKFLVGSIKEAIKKFKEKHKQKE